MDFENSSPMLEGRPMNSFFQGILGLSCVYYCGWLFHDLPANNGLLEAIDWRFPDDAMVNAKGDASTSLAPLVQTCFTQGMFLAGARMTYNYDSSRPSRRGSPALRSRPSAASTSSARASRTSRRRSTRPDAAHGRTWTGWTPRVPSSPP
jgi:hypothetical protein